jgi:hypothetical protein
MLASVALLSTATVAGAQTVREITRTVEACTPSTVGTYPAYSQACAALLLKGKQLVSGNWSMVFRIRNLGARYINGTYSEPQVSGLYAAGIFFDANSYVYQDNAAIVPSAIGFSGSVGSWQLSDVGSAVGVFGNPAELYGVGELEFSFTSPHNYDPLRATGFGFSTSFVRSGWNATPMCYLTCVVQSDVTTVKEIVLVSEPSSYALVYVGIAGLGLVGYSRKRGSVI